MKDFDSFDRKSFRQQKIDSKNKRKKSYGNADEDHKVSKLKVKDIKRKIQHLKEEELWEDWEDYN